MTALEIRHFRTDPKPVNVQAIFVTEDNVEQTAVLLNCVSYSLHVNMENGKKVVRFFFNPHPREIDDFTIDLGGAITRNPDDPDDYWTAAPDNWTDDLVPVSWSGEVVAKE